jgi:hydroxyethylthiazole kinase
MALGISAETVYEDLQKIRQSAPLVFNITNSVVQDFTANALLALGASPIMSEAIEEVPDLIAIAGALNLNMGTPNRNTVPAMLEAVSAAVRSAKPIAFDPVAVGATSFRQNLGAQILQTGKPTVVRGNLAEIAALSGSEWAGKGVDAGSQDPNSGTLVRAAARKIETIVVGTGKIDYLSDGLRLIALANGHPMMARVTGTGCVSTAFVAAFLAIQPDPFKAAIHAMLVMDIAGEVAAENSRAEGPGTFRMRFVDTCANLRAGDIDARMRILEEEDPWTGSQKSEGA